MMEARETDPRRAVESPNLLLIITDQQRFDSLGCYGSTWTRTPNLDRLASQGLRFENCYTCNPICTPARASLMTGRELPGHGVYRLHDLLPLDEILFPERLREMGYHTALFGKLHVSGRLEEAARRHPHDGFDVYEYCCEPALDLDSPLNAYGAWLREHHPDFFTLIRGKGRNRGHDPVEVSMNRWAADRTIDYIRKRQAADDGKPFFCMMSVFDPHNPYGNYPAEMDRFAGASAHFDPIGPDSGGEQPYAFEAEREHGYMGSVSALPQGAIGEMRKGYAAMVGHIDLEVGRVLEALSCAGMGDDTLVVFTSDHGDLLGDHGALAKGPLVYDPCVRVPLIARWPGRLEAGKVSPALVQLNDLAATFLGAAGASGEELAAWMPDSRNLTAGSSDCFDAFRQFAVCAYRNSGIDDSGRYRNPAVDVTMVRRGRWKLHVYHPVAGRQPGTVWKLFDLASDPREERDLAFMADSAGVLAMLKEDLVVWMLKAELLRAGRGGEAVPGKDQLIDNAARIG